MYDPTSNSEKSANGGNKQISPKYHQACFHLFWNAHKSDSSILCRGWRAAESLNVRASGQHIFRWINVIAKPYIQSYLTLNAILANPGADNLFTRSA